MTSDRDITSHVWASGSIPIPSEDFLNAIEKSRIEKRDKYEDDNKEYEEYIESGKRGNPKKLSKRDRAIKRVLSKL